MVRVVGFALVLVLLTACGGGAPRSSNADLLAIRQPTPDPTLDAVVRDLPRALAGTAATATPLPAAKTATPVPPAKPLQRQPAPTPTRTRH